MTPKVVCASAEVIGYLEAEDIMVSNEGDMVFTHTRAEERTARAILRQWDLGLYLSLPGDKAEDKAAEWDIVEKN